MKNVPGVAAFFLLIIAQLPAQENLYSKAYIQTAMRKASHGQQEHPQHPLNDWTNGAWRSSLLYSEGHTFGESSGTGFYVFGMAYGVRNGYLPAADYLPVVKKGWTALLRNQPENGMIGSVQPIGAAPSLQGNKDLWEVYGTGAFLLAGSEVLRLRL